jgi:hypothetical protein
MNPLRANERRPNCIRILATLVVTAICTITANMVSAALVPATGVDAGIARIEQGVFTYGGVNKPGSLL